MKTKIKNVMQEEELIISFIVLFLLFLLPFILLFQQQKHKLKPKINFNPPSQTSIAFFAREDAITNPRKLSLEQFRKYKELDGISDEKALKILDGLYQASILTYNFFQNGTRSI